MDNLYIYMRNTKNMIRLKLYGSHHDEKTALIGPMHLASEKTPKDKTLRKFYFHTEADPHTIDLFIAVIKTLNITLKWITPERACKQFDIQAFVEQHEI